MTAPDDEDGDFDTDAAEDQFPDEAPARAKPARGEDDFDMLDDEDASREHIAKKARAGEGGHTVSNSPVGEDAEDALAVISKAAGC